ncbi:hypothetical protein Dimus_038330 [Dionaea muscipula]
MPGLPIHPPSYRGHPFDPKMNMMSVYEDSLCLGFRLPLCSYYQQILNFFQLSPSQLTPNSWGLMAAFGSLCHDLGFEPNPRSFYEFFTLKVVFKSKPCGFHALTSRPNHVFISGLSSKVPFRTRWCWVIGPGITENPRWRGSASNITVEIFAREEELAQTIHEQLKAILSWDVSELTDPISLRDAGLAPGVEPAPSDDDEASIGSLEVDVPTNSEDYSAASDPSLVASPLPPFQPRGVLLSPSVPHVGITHAAEDMASGEEWDAEPSLFTSTPKAAGSNDPLTFESYDVGGVPFSPESPDGLMSH